MGCKPCQARAQAIADEAARLRRIEQTECPGVTAEHYIIYKTAYLDIKKYKLFTELNINEQKVNDYILLLETAILDKRQNPGSCTYTAYITEFSNDRNKYLEFTYNNPINV